MLKIKFYKKDTYDIKDKFKFYLGNIEDEDTKVYIETRVISQIDWYDKKSILNQKIYKWLTIISIIMSGSIPALTLITEFCWNIKVVIAVLSAAVTGISSIIALSNYKELWIEYRKSSEMLKSCLYLYFTRKGVYKDLTNEQAFQQLVTICEKKFIQEFNEWSLLIDDKNKERKFK